MFRYELRGVKFQQFPEVAYLPEQRAHSILALQSLDNGVV